MSEHKDDLIKIIASSILLAVLFLVSKLFVLPRFVLIVLYLVPYLIVGFETLKEAAENVIEGEFFDECFLMSIATIGAFIIGLYAEAVFVMLFFSVGELFEHIATFKSKKNISALMNIRPDKANLLVGEDIVEVPPSQVKINDIIIIKPGEKIPLDGIVSEGTGSINTSAITGESMPTDVTVGDKVLSGCINLNSTLKVTVSTEFYNSTAERILALIEDSRDKKSKTENFITKFSRYYTPAVIGTAFLVFLVGGFITKNFVAWLLKGLMFLVVSCPCALVVSVPLTYFCGIGGVSKKGVLIKGANTLESLSDVNCCLFDKTGTLTVGKFFVTAIHPETVSETDLLKIAASAENFSKHPISASLLEAVGNKKLPKCQTAEELSGYGIKAVIEDKTVFVGNDRLMQKENIKYHNCHKVGTIVHIAVDGVYAGHIIISDRTKPDSKAAIKSLKSNNIKTIMLTGDRKAVASEIANELSVDKFYAELLPEDKVNCAEKIIKENNGGKVAFIGDGINDAPVLALSDIGIAMGGLGSDAAIEAADVVLMDDKVSRVYFGINLAKRTNRIVKQNITVALAIKFGIMALIVLGLANMWLASFADVGALIIAVLNATRASKIK